MKISVMLFAGLSESAQRSQIELDMVEHSTVRDLIDRMTREFPQLAPLLPACFVSINQEYASPDQIIRSGDEIALLPPVSGGEDSKHANQRFMITDQPLSCDKISTLVRHSGAGAVLIFLGTVREFTNEKRTVLLEYEAYEPMAIKKMRQIEAEILQRWPQVQVAIHHRVGRLEAEEVSVIIAVSSPHREEAFQAGRHAIERLKQIVPIWKKEVWEDGSQWIGSQQKSWDPVSTPRPVSEQED